MTYKRKLIILSSLAAVLALLYVMTWVFDPERSGRRSDAYAWLDSRLQDSVDGIDIQGGDSRRDLEELKLRRRNGAWLAVREGEEYPARESRINDFLDELSRRDSYPQRSSSPSTHERFGLDDSRASRVTIRGGPGLPLLELLAGNNDGANIFLRKAQDNEVRSGRDRLSPYLAGGITSWFNLRLFPESENDGITAESVQRLTVRPPAGEGETGGDSGGEAPDSVPAGPVEISRVQNSWRITRGDFSLEPADIEKTRVDSYITGILNTVGDDFVSSGLPSESASVTLELADGRVLILQLGPPDEDSGQRLAAVSDSPYVYALASWAVDRLFREPEYFRRSGDSAR
ncbi:MAG: DUF4340 domain-containing protein [Treponema sp.]|nr:DUF4340 domain-containing protein [Treponema sp.]